MKKRRFSLLFLLFLGVILLSPAPPRPLFLSSPTVRSLSITYTQGAETRHIQYSHPDKIEAVLNHIRICQNSYGAAPLPLEPFGEEIAIQILLSDGSARHCSIRSMRYLLTDRGLWKPIKEEQAKSLLHIIQSTESDG